MSNNDKISKEIGIRLYAHDTPVFFPGHEGAYLESIDIASLPKKANDYFLPIQADLVNMTNQEITTSGHFNAAVNFSIEYK